MVMNHEPEEPRARVYTHTHTRIILSTAGAAGVGRRRPLPKEHATCHFEKRASLVVCTVCRVCDSDFRTELLRAVWRLGNVDESRCDPPL